MASAGVRTCPWYVSIVACGLYRLGVWQFSLLLLLVPLKSAMTTAKVGTSSSMYVSRAKVLNDTSSEVRRGGGTVTPDPERDKVRAALYV